MHEAWVVLPWRGRGSSARDRAYVAKQLRTFGVDDDDVVECVTRKWRTEREDRKYILRRLRLLPPNASEYIAPYWLERDKQISIAVVPTEDEVIIGVHERLPWPQCYILRETAIRAAKRGLEANADAIPDTEGYRRALARLAASNVRLESEHVYVLEGATYASGFVGLTVAAPYGSDPRTGFWVTHHRWYTHGERITLEPQDADAYKLYLEATYSVGPGLYGCTLMYEVEVFFSRVYGIEIEDLTHFRYRNGRVIEDGVAPTRAELEERRVLRAFANL